MRDIYMRFRLRRDTSRREGSVSIRGMFLAFALGGLVLAALGCSSGLPPIVFTSDRDGNLDIYAVSVDSKAEQNLTESPLDEFAPRVSPHGKLIAFRSGPESHAALETMAVNGTSRRPLVNGSGSYRSHRWSPNNARLAFIREIGQTQSLYVIDSDGTGSMTLTAIPGDEIGSWSPNGKSVLFSVREGPLNGLYIRNPDGVNEFRLTNTPDFSPIWSPDSRRIAFLSERDGSIEIYVMNSDGSEQRRLTNNEAPEYGLSWSPNGTQLLFVSERDGNPEIYTTDAGGTFVSRLTHNDVRDAEPVWSPDGSMIAFVSFLDGDAEIFVMDASGTNQVRLTNNPYQDTSPAW